MVSMYANISPEELQEICQERQQFQKENALLREALEAVEWVNSENGEMECPWCHAEYGYYTIMYSQEFEEGKPQHKPDCLHERALGKAEQK